MLQLVNLLRLHLVLRFHIFLAVLAPVIASHLGGRYIMVKNLLYFKLTKYVGCWPEKAGKLCADVTIIV